MCRAPLVYRTLRARSTVQYSYIIERFQAARTGFSLAQGKRFNKYDWAGCVLMCVGLVFFTLADVSVSPNFNPYGTNTRTEAAGSHSSRFVDSAAQISRHILVFLGNCLCITAYLTSLSVGAGVVLISCALLADAVIGNLQERTMRTYGSSNVEVTLTHSTVFLLLLDYGYF